MSRLRTFLILGRVSNLPTVWSNCLAGWWLGGGGNLEKLPWLFLGLSLLYTGGMFLNDAFDAEFDGLHRQERPIPSGAISRSRVWQLGLLWLVLGEACLVLLGTTAGVLGLALVASIVLYDALHKLVRFSPLFMGACRFLVYLLAADTGLVGISGWSIWCGLALAAYIVGLSHLARGESVRGSVNYWPASLMALPIFLALLINDGPFRPPASLKSLVLLLWILRCLRPTFWVSVRNVGRTVTGLLAGVVLVDWLAAFHVQSPPELGLVFLVLFFTALVLQRFAPAT